MRILRRRQDAGDDDARTEPGGGFVGLLRRRFHTLFEAVQEIAAEQDRIEVGREIEARALRQEIAGGVDFWLAQEHDRLLGVIGVQGKAEVELVRRAYVEPAVQGMGVGTRLLRHVLGFASKPVLVGTWADASWAIDFYRSNGFTPVPDADKERLLRQYWSIPERRIETSIVLAKDRWAAN